MAAIDSVTFENGNPITKKWAGMRFQTYSLCSSSSEFTVTTEGRLIQHLSQCQDTAETWLLGGIEMPVQRQVPTSAIELPVHGDIRVAGRDAKDKWHDVVVRFTHGLLECVRPLDDLNDEEQCLLKEG